MRTAITILPTWLLFPIGLFAAIGEVPHPEHPRPDFRREPWANLNGVWQFDFDPKDEGEAQRWFEPGKHEFGRCSNLLRRAGRSEAVWHCLAVEQENATRCG